MKKTPLFDEHLKLGAKIVDFAGWQMPVSYESIIDEHKCVRENIGLFDVSHMGEFFVSGKDSLKFLNKLVPQQVSKLVDSKAVYCQLLKEDGGIIDDLIIYKLHDDDYLVIVNAGGIETDYNWFVSQAKGFDVKIDNLSDDYALIAVQGPKAKFLMEKIGLKISLQPEFFSITETKISGISMYVSRTGYTGEDGFELLVKNGEAAELWNIFLSEGKEFGVKPIGLGARDTLRLEAALPLYGNDLSLETSPIEAGLAWSVSKSKEEDYNGKETVFDQLTNGVEKKLIGFKMLDKSIARHEYEIFYNNQQVGIVTSGGVSPVLGCNIGLAYVKNIKDICNGTVLQVKIREKLHDIEVVKLPFVKKNNRV